MAGEPCSRADATADESDISEVLIEDVATHWPHTERTGVARLAVGDFGLSKQRRLDPVRDLFGARLRFSGQRLEQSSPQMLRD
jgi:hypothetical protein